MAGWSNENDSEEWVSGSYLELVFDTFVPTACHCDDIAFCEGRPSYLVHALADYSESTLRGKTNKL